VGRLAQSLFPRGVLVGPEQGLDAALAQTACLLEDPSVPAIFEATFQDRGILVRVDILQRRPGNRWRLIEVKSSVEVKDYHLYDHAAKAGTEYRVSACRKILGDETEHHFAEDCRRRRT